MTKTQFVVTRTSFEYNDEYHTVTEDEGGIPVAVFDNEADAKRDARARTINDFLRGYGGNMIAGWVYGFGSDYTFERIPDCVDEDKFCDMSYDDAETVLDLDNRSDEELEEIADCLRIEPYKVTRVG